MALCIALAVTYALFYIMQYLITPGYSNLDDDAKGYVVDFVEVEREEIVERKKHKPKKPPPPESLPPELPAPKLDDINPSTDKVAIAAVPVETEIELSAEGFSLSTGDGEYLPIVKILPIYPRRAISRGIEGYVILEFTVTKIGTVKDIKVVESKPDTTIFHKAAIKAAEKFKYKPRVIYGQAVDVTGVKNKITFHLEK
jgi:protein TonB